MLHKVLGTRQAIKTTLSDKASLLDCTFCMSNEDVCVFVCVCVVGGGGIQR